METTKNKQPTKITDSTEFICAHCGEISYREEVITLLCDNNKTEYERIVTGGFKQSCDKNGTPNGAIIPFCNCREGK